MIEPVQKWKDSFGGLWNTKEEAEKQEIKRTVYQDLEKELFDSSLIPKQFPQKHEIIYGLIEGKSRVIAILSKIKD